jgi:hypothetical protein
VLHPLHVLERFRPVAVRERFGQCGGVGGGRSFQRLRPRVGRLVEIAERPHGGCGHDRREDHDWR